jgi:hypothetical protein
MAHGRLSLQTIAKEEKLNPGREEEVVLDLRSGPCLERDGLNKRLQDKILGVLARRGQVVTVSKLSQYARR